MRYANALVTGASSGLGRGLAALLARHGVRVYAAARRTALLDALKTEAGDSIVPVELDVSDADRTHDRVREIDEACGGLDLVVANAGVGEETYGKRLRWDREMVRELGLDPADLPPRDREKFWYAAIGRAGVVSPEASASADALVEPLRALGYEVGPAPGAAAEPEE